MTLIQDALLTEQSWLQQLQLVFNNTKLGFEPYIMTRFAHGCYDKGPELAQLASESEVLDSVLVIGSNGNMTLS